MGKAKVKLLLQVLLSVLLSLLVVYFFGKYYFEKWYLSMVAVSGEDSVAKVIIQSPQKVEVTQDLRVKGVLEQIKPSMIAVYGKRKAGKDVVSQLYKQKDLIGYGGILTSDGWLVSAGDFNDLKTSQIVVNYQGKIITVNKLFIDSSTGLSFLKMDMENLPVIKFSSIDNIAVGAQLLVINSDEVKLTNLSNKYYYKDDPLYSSEVYYKNLLLANNVFGSGSVVVDFQGGLVGLISNDNSPKVVPIDFLQKSFKMILENEKVAYPYLGVNFLDIFFSVGLNNQVTKGLPSGALLYGRDSERAVNNDSPLSGILMEGDIITGVDGIKISEQNTLSELVLNKKPNDTIELEYVKKEGEFEKVKVKLK